MSASSWGNIPTRAFTQLVLADSSLGHMQCWALEVKRCQSHMYRQGTHSLQGASDLSAMRRPQCQRINARMEAWGNATGTPWDGEVGFIHYKI